MLLYICITLRYSMTDMKGYRNLRYNYFISHLTICMYMYFILSYTQ